MAPRSSRSSRLAFVTLKDVLSLLRCPVRLEVLTAVAQAPLDYSSLMKQLDLGFSYVSRSLRELGQAGFVIVTREGPRRRIISLGPSAVFSPRVSGGGTLTLKTDDGNAVHLEITHKTLAELSGRDHVLSVEVTLRKDPAAPGPPHRGDARSDSRVARGRAAG